MADDSRIDPRYDPVFQRGGEAAAPAVEPRAERPVLPDQSHPAPAVTPESPVDPGRPRETDAFVGLITRELPLEDEQRTRRINPFLVALGAIAVLLVILGFAMTGYVVDHYGITTAAPVDYMLMQIYMIAAPLTALLGVSTAIGVLFVFAARWRSAR